MADIRPSTTDPSWWFGGYPTVSNARANCNTGLSTPEPRKSALNLCSPSLISRAIVDNVAFAFLGDTIGRNNTVTALFASSHAPAKSRTREYCLAHAEPINTDASSSTERTRSYAAQTVSSTRLTKRCLSASRRYS